MQIPWFQGICDWRTGDLDAFVRPPLGRQRAGYINDYAEAAARQLQRRHRTGRLRPEASASPTSLKVGDLFTLSVVLHQEDDGLLETIRPPRLYERPDLTRDFYGTQGWIRRGLAVVW